MTMHYLLIHLRDELIKARLDKDNDRLIRLGTTFDNILDAAYAAQNKEVASLLEDMGYAVNDSIIGVDWKSEIPTDEQIFNATSE